jgi:hypothetical protein
LEIFKKNDFKVEEALNQNRSGKRKRGKLNLEKAMGKNMFNEGDINKRLNLFDTMNANANKISSSDTDSNFNKNSKRSNQSGGGVNDANKSSEFILKEVQEVGPKTKQQQLQHLHHHKNVNISNDSVPSTPNTPMKHTSSTPAMYRIALRLKKLTEIRLKKTQSETTMSSKEGSGKEKAKIVEEAAMPVESAIEKSVETEKTECKVEFELNSDTKVSDLGKLQENF